jgi:hypothetical protein
MTSAISPAWTTDPNRLPSRRNIQQSSGNDLCINSPLLFDMLKKLSPEEKRTVLDTGCASQASIDFFSQYWCKLFITNSIAEIHNLDSKAIDTPHKWHRALVKSLGFYKRDKANLDIVLLWGLPNYLPADKLKELIAYLLPQTSNRLLLHTYIYNTQQISATPADYHITNENKVKMAPNSTGQINCPLYHLSDLQDFFNPLKVEHSVMLSSGIQEYLFSV